MERAGNSTRRSFNLKHFKNVVLEYKNYSDYGTGIWAPRWRYAAWWDDDGFFFWGGYSYELYTLKIRPHGIGYMEPVWRTTSEDRAREIGDAICKVGGLHYG